MASSKRSASQNPSKAKVARSDHGYGDDLSETVYRQRLFEQGKYCDLKPGSKSLDGCLKDPPALPPLAIIREKSGRGPRLVAGSLDFADFPEFRPNLTPKEVLQRGSFGGTYFRDIVSAVTGERHVGKEVIQQFPADWFAGLDLDTQVVSSVYDKNVNRFKVPLGSEAVHFWRNIWFGHMVCHTNNAVNIYVSSWKKLHYAPTFRGELFIVLLMTLFGSYVSLFFVITAVSFCA